MANRWSRIWGKRPNFIRFADSADKDAFSRQRVSLPFSLNNSKFEYSKNLHEWPELIVGTGVVTHLPHESSNLLSVPAIGDKVTKQQKCYTQYQPGNSQLPIGTVVFGDHEEGIVKRFGYHDSFDGLIIEQSGGTYYLIIRRKNPTTGLPEELSRIAQADWNIDKFNGGNKTNNPSGITFDFSKFIISLSDLQWLGGGRVRAGFDVDGVIYYAHEFNHAGNLDSVYMSTASLPFRYEIENVSNGAGGSMKQICSTVKSEGGQEVFGVPQVAKRSFYDAVSVIDTSGASGAHTPILSIRTRKLFHGKDFRGIVRPTEFEAFVEGNFPVEFILVHDGDLVKGGGTPVPLVDADWTEVSGDSESVPSVTEYTLLATGVSGGHEHNAGFASGTVKGSTTLGSDIITAINICNGIDIDDRSEADTYTLAARSKGGNATVSAILRMIEIY